MKIFRKICALAALAICPSAFAQDAYTVDLGQFQKLKVNGNINVVYRNLPDSVGMAQYMGPEDAEDMFSFNLKKNGTLIIKQGETYWDSHEMPVLYVYSDFLSSVESSSELNVSVENLAPCTSFKINLIGNGSIVVDGVKCSDLSASITTGNGSINVSGSCENASLRMVGAGLIEADRLQALNVKCTILGTGSIGCWPIDNLQVKGLGSTKIYYKGSPNIKKTGGGKLFELPLGHSKATGTEVKSFQDTVVIEEADDDEEEVDDDIDYDDEEEEDVDPDDENYQTVVTKDE